MIQLHSLLPEIAQRELRCVSVQQQPGAPRASGLPSGAYAFVEYYCEDLNCDCRRVFIEVIAQHSSGEVLASINYGWEAESFYRKRMPYDPDAARLIVEGSLDPMNTQSEHSNDLLELFQQHVLDEPYRLRLRNHYELFREELRRRSRSAEGDSRSAADESPAGPAAAEHADFHAERDSRSAADESQPSIHKIDETRIPAARRERFREVAALIEEFGRQHLDPELTGFVIELWRRICRRQKPDCLRGQPTVWAASVTHVIARMNFLFDRSQPVHLSFDTICGFYQANKTTVGSKATEIERTLRLQQHSEPGLCRRKFLEQFTTVRFSNGMVLPWSMAKEMGYLPPDARIEDLR